MAAAFLSLGLVPFVRQKMVHVSEQERTEFPFLPRHIFEVVLLQKVSEEFLRQILGVVQTVTTPPDVRKKRMPIGAAEILQSFVGTWTVLISGVQDHSPVGGREIIGTG